MGGRDTFEVPTMGTECTFFLSNSLSTNAEPIDGTITGQSVVVTISFMFFHDI